MITYYRRRAGEYERVYAKPERQSDLIRLRAIVEAYFAGQSVLELSCGTGYWTEVIARRAESVIACDMSPEVLEIARGKNWGLAQVEFVVADSYALPNFGRRHSAAFAGFWWSHIPRRKLEEFLVHLHSSLGRGAKVMFIDNRYVEGSSTPIARVDEAGDSFQKRQLENGSIYEVLKNFPATQELLQAVEGLSSSAEVILTEYFWVLRYNTS